MAVVSGVLWAEPRSPGHSASRGAARGRGPVEQPAAVAPNEPSEPRAEWTSAARPSPSVRTPRAARALFQQRRQVRRRAAVPNQVVGVGVSRSSRSARRKGRRGARRRPMKDRNELADPVILRLRPSPDALPGGRAGATSTARKLLRSPDLTRTGPFAEG
jgi:hypothetical protein